MTEQERKQLRELDEASEKAGGFVAFNPDIENEAHYDYRAIIRYCKLNNTEPIRLSSKELEKFKIK